MKIFEELLASIPDGEVIDVRIGLHWTAVVIESNGVQRCGLASTLADEHAHHGPPNVPEAGQLENYSGRDLAAMSQAEIPTLVSVGVAALNALLLRQSQDWVNVNAEEVIAHWGQDKKVALVGHFPFVPRLKDRVGHLTVLERVPGPGDLPEEAAIQVLPQADVVAITGMTLVNHSLESLLRLCSPHALVLLLGPSTPLSPLLFEHGVDLLCGSVVTDMEPVLRIVSQGGNFRQIHRAGVRLVSLSRPGLAFSAEGGT